MDWIALAFHVLIVLILSFCIRASCAAKQNSKKIEILSGKIDELRIQVGIISGRLGNRQLPISIPFSPSISEEKVRRKPGPPKGSKRKKQLEQKTPSE